MLASVAPPGRDRTTGLRWRRPSVKDHPCFGMVDFQGLAMRHVDPPFLPTRFVADLRSDEEVLWSDVKVDADRKLQRMDVVMTASRDLREVRVSGRARRAPRGGLPSTVLIFFPDA